MPTDFLAQTVALRDQAWEEVKASDAYASFQALDVAVSRMGGASMLPPPNRVGLTFSTHHSIPASAISNKPKKISHADAAHQVLREVGQPMSVDALLEGVPAKGAVVGGSKPLVNFRSTLSKDARFYSFRENGSYFWWLNGVPLPEGWNEKAGPDLLAEPAFSSSPSQEGGDGHGPATT